jgi:hypothetical protein
VTALVGPDAGFLLQEQDAPAWPPPPALEGHSQPDDAAADDGEIDALIRQLI